MTIAELVTWIESHPTTIEVSKWVLLFIIAWLSGVFKLIRKYTKKSQLKIIDTASFCFVDDINEFQGHTNVVRVAFLIDVSVINPTNEKIVIESFSLRYLTKRYFKKYSNSLYSSTLPNRPRAEMGSGIKISKVFFTDFNDDSSKLTMDGVIGPKEFQNGYIFFVSTTWGSWNPRVLKKKIKVQVHARLTTGEICKDSFWIRVIKDKEFIEKWIPGIVKQIEHPGSWGHQ
ncbi:MAG: hypothetical protein F3745_06260 [Nitrospinae bacterium]|nr:hypothetical protein [Nitrospinota bacterium]